MIIAFLGRQPAFGLAELERLLGAEHVQPLDNTKALINTLPERECGGVIKFAEIFATESSTKPQTLLTPMTHYLRSATAEMSGKITLGVSFYTPGATAKDATTLAYKLKKNLPSTSVRNLQNTEPNLSSAQVIHGKLLSQRGFEIVIVATKGGKTYLARTLREQNLASYTARDQARPKRDAFVGMLPPKLAQIMINLAYPQNHSGALLDPFCGTGVVLQEALLYDIPVLGSDLSEKMIDYTTENLAWLKRKYPTIPYDPSSPPLLAADAMTHQWRRPIATIVAEGYLGTPFSAPPSPEKLQQVMRNCDHIMRNFLINIAAQLHPGTPLCIALPCWFSGSRIFHLPLLDDIDKLGYNYVDFTHVSRGELIYRRPSQVVGRELLVISKK